MKQLNWNNEKNALLKKERNITFEEVAFFIEKGKIKEIIDHPNPEKYPNQKVFVLEINDYYFLVPFVENDTELFLKTIIPSRKAKKHYQS